MEDADEPVGEGAQGLVVGGAAGALAVVEGAGAWGIVQSANACSNSASPRRRLRA